MAEENIKTVRAKYVGKPCLCNSQFFYGKLVKDSEHEIPELLYKNELAGHEDWKLINEGKTQKVKIKEVEIDPKSKTAKLKIEKIEEEENNG